MPDFNVGAVDVELVVVFVRDDTGAAIDISTASPLQIRLRPPGSSASTLTKTAVVDTTGTDGKARYNTIAGDFSADRVGEWSIQGWATVGTDVIPSGVMKFTLLPSLA